eukprot:scaffold345_cov104-Isochrysis_galbana.AAC.7
MCACPVAHLRHGHLSNSIDLAESRAPMMYSRHWRLRCRAAAACCARASRRLRRACQWRGRAPRARGRAAGRHLARAAPSRANRRACGGPPCGAGCTCLCTQNSPSPAERWLAACAPRARGWRRARRRARATAPRAAAPRSPGSRSPAPPARRRPQRTCSTRPLR